MTSTARLTLAAIVAERFKNNPDDGLAILGDAMLQYRSTDAHNARGLDAAIEAIHALTGMAHGALEEHLFTVGGVGQFSMGEMLMANPDNETLRVWLRTAEVGDTLHEFHAETVVRVA